MKTIDKEFNDRLKTIREHTDNLGAAVQAAAMLVLADKLSAPIDLHVEFDRFDQAPLKVHLRKMNS